MRINAEKCTYGELVEGDIFDQVPASITEAQVVPHFRDVAEVCPSIMVRIRTNGRLLPQQAQEPVYRIRIEQDEEEAAEI